MSRGGAGSGPGGPTPSVTIIVPVTEEADRLDELYVEHAEALRAADRSFEFVVVVEPHMTRSLGELTELRRAGEPIEILRVGQSVGEATLIRVGLDHTSAPLIGILPAYRRVDAAVLPHLVSLVEEQSDVAAARRWPRKDSWVNRLQSRAFNALISSLAGGRIQDVASGVVAARRPVLEALPLYGDFFRFLPLLAHRDGHRVQEVAAEQHPSDARTRVRGPRVYAQRLLDTLGLFFLLRFTEKPLRFFGFVGSITSLLGGAVLLVMLLQRVQGQAMADRPLMLLGALLVVLGVQAIALGLVGEIIVHLHASEGRTQGPRTREPGSPTAPGSNGEGPEAGEEARHRSRPLPLRR